MIPATRKKLRETQFFFAHLEQQGRVAVWEANPEVAEFYFNAFVSAARTVTLALQNEAKVQYGAWFEPWLAGRLPAERLLLKRFNAERVEVIHREGSDLSSRNVLTPHDEVFPPTANDPVAHIVARMRNRESNAQVGTLQLVCRFSHDGEEAIAVHAGKDYVELLVELVHEFCSAHGGAA